jgi:serine/threonine protein kinase/Tol biopolymer transport system component
LALAPGTRLGAYEVTALLGEGGMGQVYQATDTKLKRQVAIKILPPLLASDADRLARFQREAEVLASLNHPHIAGIYGLEESAGVTALVMELVEGEDLSQRIARGAIPIDEALPIAKQIAEALEAAHEQGIIHRDLKPANIKVRADGTVKVLDFGLAKALEPVAPIGGDARGSPTITSPAITQLGVILGTAAYMSPEQAKGQLADKRSDIWSFGAVLHEMLSGRRTFRGDDIADTLASVLRQDVDWTALPASTPASVRHLVARCLERDVKRRLRDIGEARIVLDDPAVPVMKKPGDSSPVAHSFSLWRRAIPLVVGSIVIGAVAGLAAWYLKPSPTLPVTRFPFILPEGQAFLTVGGIGRSVAMSPDGTQMVYVATPPPDGRQDTDPARRPQLYLRSMSQLDAKPIPGTGLYEGISEPVFSPDGRSIAFFARADRTLKTIAVTGGAAVKICDVDDPSFLSWGLSWGPDGIVFGQGRKGVMRVPQEGGTPEVLVRVKDGEEAYGPQLLPDGQHVLFTLATGTARDRWDKARIVVQSLSSGETKTLIEGSDARYVPTGHLVYALSGIVYAVAFDPRRLVVYGPRVPVIQGVRRSPSGINGAASFSVSSTGSLAYIPGPLVATLSHLARAERKGGVDLLKLPPGNYLTPRVSPDGSRVAFGTDDGKEANVYTYRLSNEGPMERLTYGGNNRFPIWSDDSKRVAFQSDREGHLGIFWQALTSGNAERLTKAEPGTSHVPESWSPKGDSFLFSVTRGSEVSLQRFSLTDKKTSPFGGVRSSNPTNAVFSPDGRWVAYTVTEGYRTTISVQSYPETGYPVQLVAKGADNPHEAVWSPAGSELFFNPAPSRFESVSVTTSPTFKFGNAVPEVRQLTMTAPSGIRGYDITPGGQFVGIVPAGDTEAVAPAAPQILFVLNWYEELKRLVPTK